MQVEKLELYRRLPNGSKQLYIRWICSCGYSNVNERNRCKKCSIDRFTFVNELSKGKKITDKLKRKMMQLNS